MKLIKVLASAALAIALVNIWNVPAFSADEVIKGEEMHEIASEEFEYVEDGIVDSYGNKYTSNVLGLDASYEGYVSYELDGKYKRLTGAFVASEDTGSNAVFDAAIFADGKEAFSIKGYTKKEAKKEFDVDLTGVKRIDIKTFTPWTSYGDLFLVETEFEKTDEYADIKNWQSIRECFEIDSSKYEDQITLAKDSYGNLHDGAGVFEFDGVSKNEGYVLYNLEKKYLKFSGGFIAGDKSKSERKVSVKIFCDDREVFSKDDIAKESSLCEFNIDVKDVSVLKIEASGEALGEVLLVDDILEGHSHTAGDWENEKEPSCTQKGSRVKKCTECGEIIVKEEIPATGHEADGKWEVTKEATCTKKGEKVQHCSKCGEEVEKESIDLLEHTPDGKWEVVKEPTCSQEGEEVQHCSLCGEVAESRSIEMTEHDFGKWETISGSIWDPPIEKMRVCYECGETEYAESNATAWVKPAAILLAVVVIGTFVGFVISSVKKRR